MESVAITAFYAGLLGLILVVLSVRTVAVVRAKGNVGYGDAGNPDYTTIVRAQGNFIEYVPLAVLLMGFAEAGGSSATWIHAMGIALVAARILHPLGLKTAPGANPFRVAGTATTWIVILVGAGISIQRFLA